MLTRYWFEFEPQAFRVWSIGCGVTAFNYSDALSIMKQAMFKTEDLPPIKKCTENIDIRTLDQGHVIPNMGPPNFRGIWFPQGYQIT
jgi:hypothetical protein